MDPKAIDIIRDAILSSKDLVATLSNLVRDKSEEEAKTDLNAFLTKFLPQYKLLAGEDIEVKLEGLERPCVVPLSVVQLEQVFLNLVINAKDAIGSRKGEISISLQKKEIESLKGVHESLLDEGKYVLITVQDNGTGIEKDQLSKIFDFYYTTKAEGKGTGLGLPTLQKIIFESGGTLKVSSEVGVGTTFHIWVPLAS